MYGSVLWTLSFYYYILLYSLAKATQYIFGYLALLYSTTTCPGLFCADVCADVSSDPTPCFKNYASVINSVIYIIK